MSARGTLRGLAEVPRLADHELALEEVRSDPLAFLEQATARCGDLFQYEAGGCSTVFLNRPEYVRQVLASGPDRYSKLGTPDLMMLQPMLGEGLMTSEGASWEWQRHTAQPAFAHAEIVAFVELMARATDQVLSRWERVCDTREAIDVELEMSRLTIQIVTHCLFGMDLSDEGADIGAAIARMNDYMAYYDPADGVRQAQFETASLTVERIVQRILLERRLLGGGNDLLARLLAANRGSVRDQIFTYLMAGHETTAKALTWTLYLLDRDPEVLARLRREVDRVVGEGPVTAVCIEGLGYARMVLQEAMRLFPPVWLMSRRCIRDEALDGYLVPAGTLVVVSPYTLHRHPGHWPRPLLFDPDRFDPRRRDREPYTFFPFSGGPRSCIGRSFAMVETAVVLAAIVRRFDLRTCPGHPRRCEALVTLRPAGGMPMTVASRPRRERA
jgi:cytochrome P450